MTISNHLVIDSPTRIKITTHCTIRLAQKLEILNEVFVVVNFFFFYIILRSVLKEIFRSYRKVVVAEFVGILGNFVSPLKER